MKVLVTGVAGQLGHDVMNELAKRGHEGVGSDLAAEYSGIADGSAVTKMPYVSMDITDAAAVETVLQEVKPDAVVHCAAWTAVDLAEDDDKVITFWNVGTEGADLETYELAIKQFNENTTSGTEWLILGDSSTKTGKQHPAIIDESDT